MNEWREVIWLAVSALITAMLITFASVLGNVSKDIARLQQNEINAVVTVQQYREWIKYDNAIVNNADVVNCILENRTKVPAVAFSINASVDDSSNNNFPSTNPTPPNDSFIGYYIWNDTLWQYEDDYSIEAINTYVETGSTYRANLIKDEGGTIIYIWFRRIT